MAVTVRVADGVGGVVAATVGVFRGVTVALAIVGEVVWVRSGGVAGCVAGGDIAVTLPMA